MEKLKNAIVIATGEKVQVYKSSLRSTWINYLDCKTEYETKELKFL